MNHIKRIAGYCRNQGLKNVIFFLVLCLFAAFIYVDAFRVKTQNYSFENVAYIPLAAGTKFSQKLPYKDFVMSSFSLRFGTHKRKNNGELSVSLYDGEEFLENWTFPTENLLDEAFKEFKFEKPLKMLKEHDYRFELNVNHLTTENIALSVSKTPYFQFVYNGKPYKGIAEFRYGGYTDKQLCEFWALIAILAVLYAMTLYRENEKFTACLMFFVLGFTYVFIFPNGSAPDEKEHFYRAYEISEGSFISKKIDLSDQAGNYLPTGLSAFEDKSAEIGNERTFESFANTALYSPFSYIPQTLGIKVASVFTNNVSNIFTWGRIFNFLICFALCVLALHFMPFAKNLLFVVLMLPVTLQEMACLAPDGLTLSLVMLFTAYVLHICYVKPKMTNGDIIILLVLSVLIALTKIVYLVVLPIIYLIPKSKMQNKAAYVFVPLVAVVCNLIWLCIASDFLIEFNPGVNSSEQLMYILYHPFSYFLALIKSVIDNGFFVLSSTFGYFLAALTLITHPLLWICFLAVFVYQMMIQTSEGIQVKKLHRWFFMAIFVAGLLGIYTALYIQWTPLGKDVVDGVQGRYLLPLLPFLGLFVVYSKQNSTSAPAIKDNRYLYAILVFLNEIAIIDILNHYKLVW